jgi:hypothetical protein
MLTPKRLYPLRAHPKQAAWRESPARFNVVPAGRRSGKTEVAKRKLIKRAFTGTAFDDPRFFAAAPTRDQAKAIYWADLKAMIPRNLMARSPSETELSIQLITGAEIWVLGMDKPERIEGRPWDGGILDEFANMKPGAWGENVRPALSDRKGWCDLIGVPEGRNHYYDLAKYAQGDDPDWNFWTWFSSDILDPVEIAAARRQLDELVFQQEYEASFVNFTGRAYYPFVDHSHTASLAYDPKGKLAFCFDFNVEPGIAAVAQEQKLPNGLDGTGVIGEVWIPRNSNTPAVCRKLIEDWGEHEGKVVCYGDATGGSRGSAKVEGSDWELIAKELKPKFGDRLSFKVKASNPAERARVNAMNSRLKNTAGEIRLMVDPGKAPHVVRDLEGVTVLEGGSGELDKKKVADLTHISDALGYYVEHEFPVVNRTVTIQPLRL